MHQSVSQSVYQSDSQFVAREHQTEGNSNALETEATSNWQVRKQKHNLESYVIIECILYSCKLKKQRRAKREQPANSLGVFFSAAPELGLAWPGLVALPPFPFSESEWSLLMGIGSAGRLSWSVGGFFVSLALSLYTKPLFHWLGLWIHCCAPISSEIVRHVLCFAIRTFAGSPVAHFACRFPTSWLRENLACGGGWDGNGETEVSFIWSISLLEGLSQLVNFWGLIEMWVT